MDDSERKRLLEIAADLMAAISASGQGDDAEYVAAAEQQIRDIARALANEPDSD